MNIRFCKSLHIMSEYSKTTKYIMETFTWFTTGHISIAREDPGKLLRVNYVHILVICFDVCTLLCEMYLLWNVSWAFLVWFVIPCLV